MPEVTELNFLNRWANVGDCSVEWKVSLTGCFSFHLRDLLLCNSQNGKQIRQPFCTFPTSNSNLEADAKVGMVLTPALGIHTYENDLT